MSVISLEGVSKRYRIFRSRKDRLKRVLTFGKSEAGRDFWALKDINLEVEPGTSLGVVGRNGAGKSTLLKIISGVSQPTSGTVRVNGRLVALLQLGAGFNEDFTGRENVMLNGLILGIDRKEMLKRFDEIEAFADIGEFMYQPVKTYSSGMRGRLGFAVAVTVEPDILLADEILATGDALFKAKCLQKMHELRDSGTTILFVSHSMNQVKNFCSEAILLHKGALVAHGESSEVMDEYQALISKAGGRRKNRRGLDKPPDQEMVDDEDDELATPDFKKNRALGDGSSTLRRGTGDAKIENVELLDEHGDPADVVDPESDLTVRVHVRYAKDVKDSVVGIVLRNDKAGVDVFSTNTTLEETPLGSRGAGERVIVDFTFRVSLKHGRYNVTAGVTHRSKKKDSYLDRADAAAAFKVSRPSGRDVFEGLVHLPTRVKVFAPDRAR